MTTARRLAGIRRFAWNAAGKSAARCTECGRLGERQMDERQAGQLAREHTRETGHTTQARHARMVEYRRDDD
jgi:hypothetical protein